MKNLLLLVLAVALTGCAKDIAFTEYKECGIGKPPDAEKYLEANRDTQLVMMTMSYTDAVKLVTDCNLDNKLINAKNKGLAQ